MLFPSNISSVEITMVPICFSPSKTGTTLAASGTNSVNIMYGMYNIHPTASLSGNTFRPKKLYPFESTPI